MILEVWTTQCEASGLGLANPRALGDDLSRSPFIPNHRTFTKKRQSL